LTTSQYLTNFRNLSINSVLLPVQLRPLRSLMFQQRIRPPRPAQLLFRPEVVHICVCLLLDTAFGKNRLLFRHLSPELGLALRRHELFIFLKLCELCVTAGQRFLGNFGFERHPLFCQILTTSPRRFAEELHGFRIVQLYHIFTGFQVPRLGVNQRVQALALRLAKSSHGQSAYQLGRALTQRFRRHFVHVQELGTLFNQVSGSRAHDTAHNKAFG
jgi:hypothetical protein